MYKLKDLTYTYLIKESKTKLMLGGKTIVSFIENPIGSEFPMHAHDIL